MTDITIDAGNIYITNGTLDNSSAGTADAAKITTTGSKKVVRIATTKIDYNYNNPINQIPIPISSGNRATVTSYSRAIDLKRIKEVVSVQGFLADESTGTVAGSAFTKRANLITLGKQGDELTVLWGVSPYQTLWQRGVLPYGVFILKMMVTETAGIVGEPVDTNPQPERNWAIQIQLARGKDLKNI